MKTKPKPRRRAPGAGRPPKDPSGPARSVVVSLTPTQRATAERFGATPQDGIRALLDREASQP